MSGRRGGSWKLSYVQDMYHHSFIIGQDACHQVAAVQICLKDADTEEYDRLSPLMVRWES